MKVYRGLGDLPVRRRPSAVTVGNFDGLHRGHRAIIRRLHAHAARSGALSTVLTFDPHPQKVLRGEAPPALSTPEKKLALLGEAEVEQVVILRFDRKLSLVEPEEFVEKILVEELRARAVVEGSIFRFGHMARGDTTMLRRVGRRHGYAFEAVRLAKLEGRLVSSTEIRYALSEGDLAWANRALGRPYSLPGRVVRGSGRGKTLGFPTANLKIPKGLCLPRIGIYAGYLVTGGRRLPAAVSVGTNPTFGESALRVEVHVLDFEGDLYKREAEVEFVEWLRDEQVFSGPDALGQAIRADVAQTRGLLGSRKGRG